MNNSVPSLTVLAAFRACGLAHAQSIIPADDLIVAGAEYIHHVNTNATLPAWPVPSRA